MTNCDRSRTARACMARWKFAANENVRYSSFMTRTVSRRARLGRFCSVLLLSAAGFWLRADQVEMQNGDRYFGKVLSLTTNRVVMKSDVLGTVNLPRDNVATISLGPNTATNIARAPAMTNGESRAPSVALTNGNPDLSGAFRQLGPNTNFIRQVQAQFLSGAGDEANNKFNELVGGLMSGKLTVNDLRKEAKSAADQLRAVKRDLGDDSGTLDGYLSILDTFLNETAAPAGSATNAPASAPKAKPAPAQGEK